MTDRNMTDKRLIDKPISEISSEGENSFSQAGSIISKERNKAPVQNLCEMRNPDAASVDSKASLPSLDPALIDSKANVTNPDLASVDSESSFVDQTFQVMNDRHNVIYEFVMRYNDYIYSEHDYGNGDPLTMIEAHTLTYIEDHPGTTVTELTNYWHKTKGAISQIVSKLEALGLVKKTKKEGNAKNVCLYVTECGFQTSRAHKLYDTLDITKTLSAIQKECTPAEIDTFYKVISVYYKVICKDFEENKIPKRYGKRRQ